MKLLLSVKKPRQDIKGTPCQGKDSGIHARRDYSYSPRCSDGGFDFEEGRPCHNPASRAQNASGTLHLLDTMYA